MIINHVVTHHVFQALMEYFGFLQDFQVVRNCLGRDRSYKLGLIYLANILKRG